MTSTSPSGSHSSAIQNQPVALVTGASSGIGAALVGQLLSRNYRVIATYRAGPAISSEDTSPLAAAPDAHVQSRLPEGLCRFAKHPQLRVAALDVTNDASAAALAGALEKLDVLVNNAGYGVPGTVETVPVHVAKDVFNVNVWGVMRTCQAFLPIMRKGGGGLVALVSSTSGVRALMCSDVYVASKYAAEGLMESMRYSVAPDNIKVVICNPGPITTKFLDRFTQEAQAMPRVDESMASRMTKHMLTELGTRMELGQSAEDCASSIATVIDRELPKRIDQGNHFVHFWNGTSDFARDVCENIKRNPDGHSGPLYTDMWKRSFEAASAARISKD